MEAEFLLVNVGCEPRVVDSADDAVSLAIRVVRTTTNFLPHGIFSLSFRNRVDDGNVRIITDRVFTSRDFRVPLHLVLHAGPQPMVARANPREQQRKEEESVRALVSLAKHVFPARQSDRFRVKDNEKQARAV